MATTLNADTVTGGLIATGDASGDLALQAAGTTKILMTSSGTSVNGIAYPTADGAANRPVVTNGSGQLSFGAVGYPTADGTSGQLLQTNGSGQLSFVDPSGGAYEVVADTVLNNTYIADFTVTSGYQYIFEFDSIQNDGAGGSALYFRYSTDGGSTFVATDYGIIRNGNTATTFINTSGSSSQPPITYYNVPQLLSSNETFQAVYYYSQRANAQGTLFGDSVGTSTNGREYVQHRIKTSTTVNLIRLQTVTTGYDNYGRVRLLRRV